MLVLLFQWIVPYIAYLKYNHLKEAWNQYGKLITDPKKKEKEKRMEYTWRTQRKIIYF